MALNSLDEEILQGPIGGSMLERFRSFIAEAAAAASQVSGATRCCGSRFCYCSEYVASVSYQLLSVVNLNSGI